MPIASIHGVTLNYRQAGEGPDLVLVHGLGANHAFWRLDVLLPLARRFRVTVYDLRGHGYSGMPSSGYTSADLAGDLVGLLDHLGIERAPVAGHSFGGVVALHAALRNPERVAGLALIDARVRAVQETLRLQGWPDWEAVKGMMSDLNLEVPEDEDDAGLYILERLASPEFRDLRRRIAKYDTYEGYVPFAGLGGGQRSAQRFFDLLNTTTAGRDFRDPAGLTREAIRALAAPLLALYGENSRCVESCRGLQALVPGCRVVLVPGAGHYFPATRPQAVVEALVSFHAEVGAGVTAAVEARS
ncbi:MAG: alpha/beta fold hydrolase [Candidatus Polarisedimenticolia bacterium]